MDSLPGPASPTGASGTMGGPAGIPQGHIGSMFGQANGAQEGLNRFEAGGMDDNPLMHALAAMFPGVFGGGPTAGEGMGKTISPPNRSPVVPGAPGTTRAPHPPVPPQIAPPGGGMRRPL